MEDTYIRKALITNIVDGDTVDARVDLGFNVFTNHRLRLLLVDTPERGEEGYKEATDYTKDNLLGKEVLIRSYKSDNWNRYLADIWIDGRYFNQELLDKGLAKLYHK